MRSMSFFLLAAILERSCLFFKTFFVFHSEIFSVSHQIACGFIYICTVNASVCFCVQNSIIEVKNRISPCYRPSISCNISTASAGNRYLCAEQHY